MPNFADQLKVEISRISRKEVRAETRGFKKASAQYRADIAALKRRVASLEASVSKLNRLNKRKQEPDIEAEGPALRFRAGGFVSLRKKLALSAAEMAKLLNVSAQSIYHWESGKSKPRPTQLSAIAQVRKLGKRDAAAMLAGM